MFVIKRDGTKVKFEKAKIGKAILKAYNEVYSDTSDINAELASDICSDVCRKLEAMAEISVEDIQDIVEATLMDYDRNVAKVYITYRYKRSLVRQSNTTDKSILELIDGVNDYWNNEDIFIDYMFPVCSDRYGGDCSRQRTNTGVSG